MDTLTAGMLAEVIQEPEKVPLARVLKQLGQERCAAILADALTIESSGGMLLKDGSRRRTPGGTFFQLVKDACTGKERHFIFAVLAAKKPPGTLQIGRPAQAPLTLTTAHWKGLTPMSVTATLKLVLRDLPETRESNGLVYMALQNEPRGLPKGISLESGPLYLSSPAKKWKTACARAAEIRAIGTPALLIVEAHVSTKEGALIGVVKGVQVVEGKAPAQTPSA
ncbi:MAG TPA: phosphorylated adapter RNA export RNA-binding domain-containing protein [Candidatus Tectomicrobia bacterium]